MMYDKKEEEGKVAGRPLSSCCRSRRHLLHHPFLLLVGVIGRALLWGGPSYHCDMQRHGLPPATSNSEAGGKRGCCRSVVALRRLCLRLRRGLFGWRCLCLLSILLLLTRHQHPCCCCCCCCYLRQLFSISLPLVGCMCVCVGVSGVRRLRVLLLLRRLLPGRRRGQVCVCVGVGVEARMTKRKKWRGEAASESSL